MARTRIEAYDPFAGSVVDLGTFQASGAFDATEAFDSLYGFDDLYNDDFAANQILQGESDTVSDILYGQSGGGTVLDLDPDSTEVSQPQLVIETPEAEEKEKQNILNIVLGALKNLSGQALRGAMLQYGVKNIGALATALATNVPFVRNTIKNISDVPTEAIDLLTGALNNRFGRGDQAMGPNQKQDGSGEFSTVNTNRGRTPAEADTTPFVGSGNDMDENDLNDFGGNEDFVSDNFDPDNQNEVENYGGSIFIPGNDDKVNGMDDNDANNNGNNNVSNAEDAYNSYLDMIERLSGRGIGLRSDALQQARDQFVPQLFGAAEDYRSEALSGFARTAGAEEGADFSDVLDAFTRTSATEEKRLIDESRAVGVASGRSFDPAAMQGAIDLNQLLFSRKVPFIQGMLPELTLGKGLQFAGALDATVQDTLPSFADQMKLNLADQQMDFNQQLLEAQEKSGNINNILGFANAFGQAYGQDLFGIKSVVDPFANLIGTTIGNTIGTVFPNMGNRFSGMGLDPKEEAFYKFLQGGGSLFGE